MIRIAIESYDKFEVSDIEKEISGISYTHLVLKKFKSKFENTVFFLLMGSDQYLNFKD